MGKGHEETFHWRGYTHGRQPMKRYSTSVTIKEKSTQGHYALYLTTDFESAITSK